MLTVTTGAHYCSASFALSKSDMQLSIKNIFLSISAAVLLTVLFAGAMWWRGGQNPAQQEMINQQADGLADIPERSQEQSYTLQESPPQLDRAIPLDGDIYLVGSRYDDSLYRISYYVPKESFTIFLLQEPLADTRLLAEAEFLRLTHMDKSGACLLSYMVVTPVETNAQLAGKNLGFSFCPGAIQL